MYRNTYQRGMLTVFFSCGSKPLGIWETHTKDGYITTFLDQDIKSMVFEIGGTNISTTYIMCPKGKQVLGITMPFLIMIVKNLKKYFTFEVTILDESNTRRRFRVSNFQSTTQILPLCTVMPIGLSEGWNQIQFNLAEFTRRAYNKQFLEVQKIKINANIRLRRVYFTDRLIPEDQLPPEYKLFFPLASHGKIMKGDDKGKENLKPSSSQQNVIAGPIETQKGSRVEVSKIASTQIFKRPSQEATPPQIEDVPKSPQAEPLADVAPTEGTPAEAGPIETPIDGGETSAETVTDGESTLPGTTPSEPGNEGESETGAGVTEADEPPTEAEAPPAEVEATPAEAEALQTEQAAEVAK